MDDRIFITKDSHVYTKQGQAYTSVSELISKYKQPFNKEYWSWRKAYEAYVIDVLTRNNPLKSEAGILKEAKSIIKDNITRYLISSSDPFAKEYENLDLLLEVIKKSENSLDVLLEYRQGILDSWDGKRDKANLKGNSYHRAREINAIKRQFETNAYDNKNYDLHGDILLQAYPTIDDPTLDVCEALIWNLDNADVKYAISNNYLEDLPDGFYPELIMWNDEYKIAGTSDRIFIETLGIGRAVDVDDYKTNNVIDKKSFYEKGKGHKMMQYPLNHIMDCKHNHYHLQVSVYAYMLEQMGFEVRNVGYHHINFLNKLPYMRDEVIVLLNHYRQRNIFSNKI